MCGNDFTTLTVTYVSLPYNKTLGDMHCCVSIKLVTIKTMAIRGAMNYVHRKASVLAYFPIC